MIGLNKIVGIALAGALTMGAVSSSSAMPIANGTAIKQVVPATATDVRWRGGGIAAGIGLGILGGAVIAGGYPYRYGYGYGYGYPAYAYYPGPYYYGGPYYGPRRYWGYRHRYWHRHWRRW